MPSSAVVDRCCPSGISSLLCGCVLVAVRLRACATRRWGGPNDFFGGHMANGRRVVTDGKASTRHVIAGLAQALGGAAT
jgi:hypothetical protein